MSLADTFRPTCSVCLTDSRRPSHALVGRCRLYNDLKGLRSVKMAAQGPEAPARVPRCTPGQLTRPAATPRAGGASKRGCTRQNQGRASTAIVWEA
jgi:hypothetical protein